jgi:hypothetical protein
MNSCLVPFMSGHDSLLIEKDSAVVFVVFVGEVESSDTRWWVGLVLKSPTPKLG